MTQPAFGAVAAPSRRALAYIIDALIATGIGIVLTVILVVFAVTAGADGMLAVLAVGGPVAWLLLAGWFVVYTVMQGGKGSIGMRAQGLRLVRESDGGTLGFGRALLRNVIFGLVASVVVGYFTPLFDGSGRFQGWHDKVARSLMLDTRNSAVAGTADPATEAMAVPSRPPSPAAESVPVPGIPAPRNPAPRLSELATPTTQDWQAPLARPVTPVPETDVVLGAASAPAAPGVSDDALIAFVPGITQDVPPERRTPTPTPSAPAEATPAPGPVEAPASDPLSVVVPAAEVDDIEDTRISIPGHRLVFTWDDGTRVTVSRRTLFGRNPSPEDGAVVVAVRDETLSLSKTHFEAAAETSGGWVMDRHSTNGTVVVRDGQRLPCTPGQRMPVRLGDAIEIGDRIVTVGGYA